MFMRDVINGFVGGGKHEYLSYTFHNLIASFVKN